MSHDRGLRLQNVFARYIRPLWPLAESAGAGRKGTDVTNTPGVVWEIKTAREFKPTMFVRQAKTSANGSDVPHPVIYWPQGIGEANVGNTLFIVTTDWGLRLLREAGYTP